MESQKAAIMTILVVLIIFVAEDSIVSAMASSEKRELRKQVVEMFKHGYDAYMNNAFPADELMPLSCKGRYRGTLPSRGDVDDSLGNFTLTLIDTLDTLVVLGDLEEFEKAVKLVIENAKFDSDVIVSVFETNIRVLGGLIGGHVLATFLQKKKKSMAWYNDDLLSMAKEVGYRLLPAFNTTTGIPYPRVNLKRGITKELMYNHKDTCTACAGTMILEFAALSRLTGEPVFEDKAHRAMDYLWQQRHRASDLVGTVINVHNGDWIRRESGVGAGIDSYYEYVLKAYILLGDDTYLQRFNRHYDAVMKYVSQGPMLVDVHMHKPQSASRNFMDSLLAFWPGLQVLKGDLKPAMETHEMLYQIIQRHNFLPEAFTTDFRVHWGQHPLRPEFVESTYFLYKATGDPHYLRVGKEVLDNLNQHARVACGFAAIKDVTTGMHEDQMDSFVLAETFKYLYLLFSEKSDLVIDIDDYIFSTEAHLLPLSLSTYNASEKLSKVRREVYENMDEFSVEFESMTRPYEGDESSDNACPNLMHLHQGANSYVYSLRNNIQSMVDKITPREHGSSCINENRPRLKAADFIAGNKGQLEMLHNMGIRIATMADGRIQLLHSASDAVSAAYAEDGMKFMQEMIQLSRNQQHDTQHEPMVVQLISEPYYGSLVFKAGPAQFGYKLKTNPPIQGPMIAAEPFNACQDLQNAESVAGRIVLLERGQCMFVDKARTLQKHNAIGGIVIDHTAGSTSDNQPLFAMSGDGQQDIKIPMVFLFNKEGQQILDSLAEYPDMEVILASKEMAKETYQTKDNIEPYTRMQQELEIIGPDPVKSGGESRPKVEVKVETKPQVPTNAQENVPPKVHDIRSQERRGDKLYKLEAGTSQVKLEVDINSDESNPKLPEAVNSDVIQLTELPDGTKQLSFKFEELASKEPKTKPELNQIYVNLVSVLQKRTNFNELEGQGDYLTAIARLLESAYFNVQIQDITKAQTLFDRLANRLVIYPKETFEEESESLNKGSDDNSREDDALEKDSSKHYASQEDLSEEYVKTVDSKDKKSQTVIRASIDVSNEIITVTETEIQNANAPAGQGRGQEQNEPIASFQKNKKELFAENIDLKSHEHHINNEDIINVNMEQQGNDKTTKQREESELKKDNSAEQILHDRKHGEL